MNHEKQKTEKKQAIKPPVPVAMTKNKFFEMIDEAENNIQEGKVYSQAEVEEKMRARHARI